MNSTPKTIDEKNLCKGVLFDCLLTLPCEMLSAISFSHKPRTAPCATLPLPIVKTSPAAHYKRFLGQGFRPLCLFAEKVAPACIEKKYAGRQNVSNYAATLFINGIYAYFPHGCRVDLKGPAQWQGL
ncbi:MAG: hypothetical protein ACLT0Y_01745 [Christensenellales bacterium]